ncbi:MAG: rod shape-determining protein MreC [Actinobacteria bacterium]|nr:rod shape-determining protein MreC [Actinomycetota bacterium]
MALRARTRSARSLVVLLVLASLLTITVDYRQGQTGPLAGLGRVALAVITPLQDAVSKVIRPVGDFFSTLTRIPSIKQENERLREENQALRTSQIRISELETEVAQLQAIVGLVSTYNLPYQGARVIGSGVSNFEWSVTIDKGSDDGIRVDMPVVTGAGLVGRVVEVTGGSAKVMLILDTRSHVAARIVAPGLSQVTGDLQGQGPEDLDLDLVDPDVPIEAGATVVTAGYDGAVYPPSIPIGTVSRVVPDPTALDQLVTVRPFVDFSALDIVAVVLTPPSE